MAAKGVLLAAGGVLRNGGGGGNPDSFIAEGNEGFVGIGIWGSIPAARSRSSNELGSAPGAADIIAGGG